jgi:hypothetical protein
MGLRKFRHSRPAEGTAIVHRTPREGLEYTLLPTHSRPRFAYRRRRSIIWLPGCNPIQCEMRSILLVLLFGSASWLRDRAARVVIAPGRPESPLPPIGPGQCELTGQN